MARGVSTEPPTALLWVFRCRVHRSIHFYFACRRYLTMTQVLRGYIVLAPAMGRLDILEHG